MLWPTVQFIRNCSIGYQTGGSICYKQSYYDREASKKLIKYKYEGNADIQRGNVAPHIKTMFACKGSDTSVFRFFYMGSHNLSKSAWGQYELKETQFQCSSFEIGVVFTGNEKESNVFQVSIILFLFLCQSQSSKSDEWNERRITTFIVSFSRCVYSSLLLSNISISPRTAAGRTRVDMGQNLEST